MKQTEQLTPLLVDAGEAARLLSIGKSLFYQLHSTGRIPQKIKLNNKGLWSYDLLKLWARNGCPMRDSAEWLQIMKAENGKS